LKQPTDDGPLGVGGRSNIDLEFGKGPGAQAKLSLGEFEALLRDVPGSKGDEICAVGNL